jgi:hypothetical protein
LQYVLRDCKSSKEIESLTSPSIDLYVREFTPRLHCSEVALQLAENTIMFLVRVNTGVVGEQGKMSFRYYDICPCCSEYQSKRDVEYAKNISVMIDSL